MGLKKIRIGVLGCANIAFRSVIPAIKKLQEFELIAVSSRSKEKADKFAQNFDCDSVVGYENLLKLDDIDTIYIPLPTGLHEEWVTKCINAGKNILVEKSFATDYNSAKRMVNLTIASDLVIMENLMFQYHLQHKFVLNLINQNEIGSIRLFRSSFGFPPLKEGDFRYNKELGGGALLDAGCYPVKASQLFLGSGLSVKASDLYFNNTKKIDIFGSAYLLNQDGVASEIAFGFDNYYQCNYEIWGSEGKISVERAFTPPPGFKPKVVLEKKGSKREFVLDEDNHFESILKEFYRRVHSGNNKLYMNEILDQAYLLDEVRSKNGKK